MKTELTGEFLIVDIGFISFYLGLNIKKNREKKIIKLFKPAYIDKIPFKFYLNQANQANTLIKKSVILLLYTDKQVTASKIEKYQHMIESLIFSMVETRPNIAFVTSYFSKNLSHQYTDIVMTILKYLRCSKTWEFI